MEAQERNDTIRKSKTIDITRSTSILPPIPSPTGRLELNEKEDQVIYIKPIVKSPWKNKKSIEKPLNNDNSTDTLLEKNDERENEEEQLLPLPSWNSKPCIVPRKTSTGPLASLAKQGDLGFRIQLMLQASTNENGESDFDNIDVVKQHMYQRKLKLKSLRKSNSDAQLNNIKLASDSNSYTKLHEKWVEEHKNRISESKTRFKEEQDKRQQHILASTGSAKSLVKQLRRERAELQAAQKRILKAVFIAAVASSMRRKLLAFWTASRLHFIVKRCAKHWISLIDRNRKRRDASLVVTTIMCETAALRRTTIFFVNVKTFLTKIRVLQRVWSRKLVKRHGRTLVFEKIWMAQEERERLMVQAQLEKAQKKTKGGFGRVARKNAKKAPSQEFVPIPADVKKKVIKDVVLEAEKIYVRKQEEFTKVMYPHLVQVLYDHNPSMSRREVSLMADRFRDLRRLRSALSKFPGALDGCEPYPGFSFSHLNISDVLKTARGFVVPVNKK